MAYNRNETDNTYDIPPTFRRVPVPRVRFPAFQYWRGMGGWHDPLEDS